MTHRFLPLAAASLLALPAAAPATTHDAQLWLSGGATVDLGGGFKLSEEMVARFGDAQKGLYEIENSLLLGYKLSDKVTLWAGYTHDPLYAAGRFTRMERRAREQVTADNIASIGPGTLSVRLRAEQRWRDGFGGTAWRLRPYVRYQLPLSETGKTTLTLAHESFVNLNHTDFQTEGYDRMRNSIAVKFPLAGPLSAEVGYLNQYGIVRGGRDKMDHAATMGLSFSF